MYTITVPDIVNRITEAFYILGVWNRNKKAAFFTSLAKAFHCIYFLSFFASVLIGAAISNDMHEFIFLVDLAILLFVHVVRMFYLMYKSEDIISLISQIGTHFIDDHSEFADLDKKLKLFNNFAQFFVMICIVEVLFALGYPVVSGQKILLNIAFPWKKGVAVFWMTHLFIALGCAYSILWFLLSVIIWYLMIHCSSKYQLLGNRLRKMGAVTNGEPMRHGTTIQEKIYIENLVGSIKMYRQINKYVVRSEKRWLIPTLIGHFSSAFSNFFLIQIFTSSLSICTSVYILAFNAQHNLVQDGIYCVFLLYNLFDILAVMYMGNEIKLSSDRLSLCLYESDWIVRSLHCKKLKVVMMEGMKKPHELIVGKVYPLNLQTFTSIVNGAYSLFNFLRKSNLRN